MDHTPLQADIRALVAPGLERRGFLAAFTERTGGSSTAPFDSLNLGPDTGDDPVLIQQNHERIASALGIGALRRARQVHGDTVINVEDARSEAGSTGLVDLGVGDALITSARAVPLAVMVADCVSLVLASEAEELLAAVHLGWRGIAAGLTQRALAAFTDPANVVAAIGPSIGPCHYEVGEEVVRAVHDGTGGLAVSDETGPKPRLDLGSTVGALLRGAGVREVDRAAECTACEPSRFFSYRRDGTTGRQAMVAMRL